jgi:hypothetical protein
VEAVAFVGIEVEVRRARDGERRFACHALGEDRELEEAE